MAGSESTKPPLDDAGRQQSTALARTASMQQLARIQALATELGWDADTLKAQLRALKLADDEVSDDR